MIKHIITFGGTPFENAEDQMILSDVLATVVGTRSYMEDTFMDGLPFKVSWNMEFINIEVENLTFQLTQPEALHQAANLRQASLSTIY